MCDISKKQYKKIPWVDVEAAIVVFENDDFPCLLHSALDEQQAEGFIGVQNTGDLNNYSFLSANPFLKITAKNGKTYVDNQVVHGNPFDVVKKYLEKYACPHIPHLPPMQGGAMGWFGYELGSYLETIPMAQDLPEPYGDMAVGFYDWVIAFDHKRRCAYIIANGITEDATCLIGKIEDKIRMACTKPLNPPQRVGEIMTAFTRQSYEKVIQQAIDFIYAGDIFQTNISQPFAVSFTGASPLDVYLYLCHINPAPFCAYMDCGTVQIASSSPERFLSVAQDSSVQTCPIKGTQARGKTTKQDKKLADTLLSCPKNRAENVMIVDLLRNDLSKVCAVGSVNVEALCKLETYQSVHHLVSVVRGVLSPGQTALDLLKACYPGGSITGAPKIRAQEIIASLEPVRRGVYCGSIGYVSFSGSMDTNIAIRTMTIQGNRATFNAGGGIVSDSIPSDEYLETLAKAKKLFHVFNDDTADR